MEVIINVDKYRRIRVNNQSGWDLEAYVKGIGWVLDNDADVSDHILNSHISTAITLLNKALPPCCN